MAADAPDMSAPDVPVEVASSPDRSFFRELWRRRVPQVLGGYVASCASAVLFFSFLTERYGLSPYLVDILLWGLILLIPTVVLLAYRHGGPGPQHWTALHLGSVVLNIVVAVGVLTFAFWGKPLSATTTTVTIEGDDGETIQRVVAREGHRKRLALFAFENATGDDGLAYAETAVPVLLHADLSQDPFFRVLLGHHVAERLARVGFPDGKGIPLALQRKIARELSYSHVVTGTVRAEGGGYALDLALVDAETGREQAAHTFSGATLAALADAATAALKDDLDLPDAHVSTTEDLPASEVVTTSAEALAAYARGLDALSFAKDLAAAERLLGEAVALDPTFARAHLDRANALLVRQDQAAGLEALRAAQQHDYRLSEPQRYAVKAQRLFYEGEPDQALEAVEQWTTLYPDDTQAYLVRAQFRTFRGDYAGVAEDYERVLELDPSDVGRHLSLGDLYRNQIGDADRALAAYRAFLRDGNEPDVAYRRIGLAHEAAGRLDSALTAFDQAIAADPENLTALRNKALVYAKLGRFGEAEASLREVLTRARTDRERMNAYSGLATAYQRQGRYDASLDAQEAEWDAVEAQGNAGMALIQQAFGATEYARAGMREAAQELVAEAQAFPSYDAPSFFRANVDLSEAYLVALDGDADRAEQLVARAAEVVDAYGIEQARPMLGFFRAEIAAAQGDFEAAVEPYAAFVESQPPNADLLTRYANVLFGAGRLNEARARYEEALALVPAMAEARLGLAKIALAEGATEEAQAYLDEALAIWADAPDTFPLAAEARALRAALMNA